MVDGFFASNMFGVTPFVAVNLISPIFYILYSLGLMFGTGTSAAVAKIVMIHLFPVVFGTDSI